MENNHRPKESEMTFFELMSYIGVSIKKGFINLMNALSKFFRFAYKNIGIILTTIILFVIAGIAYYIFVPQKYTMSGTLFTYGSSAGLAKDFVERTTFFQGNGDTISDVKAYYFVDERKDGIPDYIYEKPDKDFLSDTNIQIMNDRLFVEMKVLVTVNSETVTERILSVLNTNSSLVKNFEFYKQSLQNDIESCSKEIDRIDSLTNRTYFENNFSDVQISGGSLVLARTNVQLFYEDMFKLQEKHTLLTNKMQELDIPVDIPAGLSIKPDSIRGIGCFVVLYFFIGLFVGALIALFFENRKRILSFLNS